LWLITWKSSTSVLLANFSPSIEQHSSLRSRMHQGFAPTRQALYPVGIHLGDDDCPFRSARVFGNFANHKRQYDPQGDMVLPGIRKTRHGTDHEPLACVYKVAPKTSPRCTVRIHSFFSSGLRRCAFFESHPRPRLRRLDLLVFDCLLLCLLSAGCNLVAILLSSQYASEMTEASIQPALGFIEVPSVLLCSIRVEDHNSILVASLRGPNTSHLRSPSLLVSPADHI